MARVKTTTKKFLQVPKLLEIWKFLGYTPEKKKKKKGLENE